MTTSMTEPKHIMPIKVELSTSDQRAVTSMLAVLTPVTGIEI